MANFSPRHCKLVASTISYFKVGSNFNTKLNYRNIFNVIFRAVHTAATKLSENNLFLGALREPFPSDMVSAFNDIHLTYMKQAWAMWDWWYVYRLYYMMLWLLTSLFPWAGITQSPSFVTIRWQTSLARTLEQPWDGRSDREQL